MLHETPSLLHSRMIRRRKALQQTADSMHGLGLDRWLRIVESDESRDREDSTSLRSTSKERLIKTVVPTGQASDSMHGPDSNLRIETRPRKRLFKPP